MASKVTNNVTVNEGDLHVMQEVECIDNSYDYKTTVLIGSEYFAFCTCKTFWMGDFHGDFQWHVWYFGATVGHGCPHLDAAIERYGWRPAETKQEGGAYPGEGLENLLLHVFDEGLRAGRALQ